MSNQIEKKQLEALTFLYIKKQVKADEVSAALAEALPAVFQYIMANGIPFAGPPTTRYVSFGPGLITIEAGMPVAGESEGEGEILAGTIGGGPVASTIHQGSYDTLDKAHEAIQHWIMENGEEAGGAPWEVYITDPGENPDPATWQTEVVHPLKREV